MRRIKLQHLVAKRTIERTKNNKFQKKWRSCNKRYEMSTFELKAFESAQTYDNNKEYMIKMTQVVLLAFKSNKMTKDTAKLLKHLFSTVSDNIDKVITVFEVITTARDYIIDLNSQLTNFYNGSIPGKQPLYYKTAAGQRIFKSNTAFGNAFTKYLLKFYNLI